MLPINKIKRLVLGDMHGRFDTVKEIYDAESPDEVIILGDYLDSFYVDHEGQIKGFKALLELQEAHGVDKFKLLIGNHDFHYIHPTEHYSGKNFYIQQELSSVIKDAIENNKMHFIYVDRGYIYSHAGVTKEWLGNDNIKNINSLPLDRFIFTFKDGGDVFGSSKYSSPIWVRPNTLLSHAIDGYNQIVGHTHNLVIRKREVQDKYFYFIDSLPFEYLIQNIDGDTIETVIKTRVESMNQIKDCIHK